MAIKNLIEQIKKTEKYKEFQKENPKMIFVASFASVDLEKGGEQISIDFFLPEKKRIAVFESPSYEPKIHDDEIKDMKEQKLDLKIDIGDLTEQTKKIVSEKFKGFGPARLIAVLKEDIWNATLMNNALGILKIKFNAMTGELISAEKGSFMDFARK